ncbi:putative pentatricopeptide repeat-containing protein At1g17630 isoform X1 [Ananas comosus]|uniref:Pentatricopeptide repeat-containing protein At1g17630 isoform X1 n=1 Tax=Ananas comosus TaxID=4615 RepID=A0A6P5FUM9_ANACO|nr:putative pentatricopeptide repeat-containing protein At1g17630 isoform X1 [Ananas comosus]
MLPLLFLLGASRRRHSFLLLLPLSSSHYHHGHEPAELDLDLGLDLDLERSTFQWNANLRSHLTRGAPTAALALYFRMRSLGALPDHYTLPLALRACSGARASRACFLVHAHAASTGLHRHLHVANELVVMYAHLGLMETARKVFDDMPHRSVFSWNALLSGYSSSRDLDRAREVFARMEEVGPTPDAVTWTALLSAHAKCRRHGDVVNLFDEMRAKGCRGTPESLAVALSVCPYVDGALLDKGREIHGYAVRNGFEAYSFVNNSLICMYGKLGSREDAERLFLGTSSRDLVTWNSLISSYAAAGLCDEAYDIFLQMDRTGTGELAPNVVSWSAVIGGFALSGMIERSLELFRKMQQCRVVPNSVTLATVLSACAELSALRLGREVHGHAVRGSMVHNLLIANGLLNVYSKSGNLRSARLVFDGMRKRDLISWNTMVAGYGMHGLCDEAFDTFYGMVRAGVEPDNITFVAVLSACSHAGRVSDGREVFDQMLNKYKVSPGIEHYTCMVDLLGRAGLLKEAIGLIKKMAMKPSVSVWGALLNSCRIYGNAAVAEDTMKRLGIEEEDSTGNYIMLSNIYAACGMWEEAKRVRVKTKERGLKKSPGQSWIELKNKVCVFSAGDASPPDGEDVYGALEDLYRQMEHENDIIEGLEEEFNLNYMDETQRNF